MVSLYTLLLSTLMNAFFHYRCTKDLACKYRFMGLLHTVLNECYVFLFLAQSAQALLFSMFPLVNNSTTQTVQLFTMDSTFEYMTINPTYVIAKKTRPSYICNTQDLA